MNRIFKANRELNTILRFKYWIESNYEDIINNETIEIYSMIYNLTNEEKEILERRFL